MGWCWIIVYSTFYIISNFNNKDKTIHKDKLNIRRKKYDYRSNDRRIIIKNNSN